MKDILKRLLEENKEMQQEIIGIEKGDYKTGYLQALINVESSLKFELEKLNWRQGLRDIKQRSYISV